MNQLTRFPKLSHCTSLHTLDLSKNYIDKISDVHPNENPNLVDLNLKTNSIMLKNDKELNEFLNIVLRWTRLTSLNVDDNPFMEI